MNQALTKSRPNAPRILWLGGILLAGIGVLAFSAGLWLTRKAKPEAVRLLREHYRSDVKLADLEISLLPSPRVSGNGLELRTTQDGPPLIRIAKFSARAGWMGLFTTPRRLSILTLEGLEINVPPKGDRRSGGSNSDAKPAPFLVEEIRADGTRLRILPKDAGKEPLEYEIYRLQLHSVGVDRPMTYQAQLRNAKPPGLIDTVGHFGPWNVEEAGDTPLDGDYSFQNADLSVFNGISGHLSSSGHFRGQLGRIDAEGTTDVPDFNVRVSGRQMPLKTEYKATIDGTDGDTYLHPVIAHFGRSTVVAQGAVAGTAGQKGKTVTLDATVDQGRVEDMLLMAVKGPPVLRGPIRYRSKIVIPPGDEDVVRKLKLDGHFDMGSSRFTSTAIQQKVGEFSKRAQGEPEAENDPNVISALSGRFRMGGGSMALSGLSFRVPGAAVHLDGNYGLIDETLDFSGTARLDAKVSQTMTGWKSVLLKVADPFFKPKDGGRGAEIPIHIGGTRDKLDIGLGRGKK